MKLRILTALVPAMLSGLALHAAPGAHWLSTEHDFGAFNEEMGVVTTTFKVVNTGDEPLLILAARANCGCTTPTYTHAPVAPGDTASVTVGFNPSGRIGRFHKHVLVDTNVPVDGVAEGDGEKRSRQQLNISGTVIGAANTIAGRYPAGVGAVRLRNGVGAFGQIAKGKLATVSVQGYNRSADSIRPIIAPRPAYISAIVRPEVVAPGEMFNVLLNFNTRDCREWGIVTDTVDVRSGDQVFAMPVVAIITDDFSRLTDEDREKAPVLRTDTDKIDFGVISTSDTPGVAYFTVENHGKSPLELRRVYTVDPALTVKAESSTVKPGKHTRVKVTVDPALTKAPMLNARVMIVSNDPGNSQVPVRVTAEVR